MIRISATINEGARLLAEESSPPNSADHRDLSPRSNPRNVQAAIDRQVEDAARRGAFDNLPGKGKPLDLTPQPGEHDGTWAARQVTKNAGFSLPWIDLAKEIDADIAACKQMLEWASKASRIRRKELLAEYRERALAAREKSRNYNLMVPSPYLQRRVVDARALIAEMERAIGEA
jgi:hypothetical protein